MSAVRALSAACASAALLLGCPGPAPQSQFDATRISATTLEAGAILKRGDTFTVTADGSAVVTANFGPRQVARMVTKEEPTATFRAEEFPEGGAQLLLALRDNPFQSTWDAGEVWIDLSPPSLVRVDNAQAGAGQEIVFWFWDAVALERVELKLGEVRVERTLPRTFASTRAHEAKLNADDLPEGAHTLTMTVWDFAGNQGDLEQEVLIDRTLPVASFVAPSNGQTATGTLELEVWSEDNVAVGSVELRANGSLVAVLAGGRTSVTQDTSLFPKGLLTLTATARDTVGNLGEPATLSVVVE